MATRFTKLLGSEIADARMRKNWSQEHLGLLVGKSRQLVNDWEKGRRDPGTLELAKFVKLLEIDFNDLAQGVDTFDMAKHIEERKQWREFCSHG